MREAYHVELEQLADNLAAMSVQVAEAMERATRSLLEADLGLAEQVISDDAKVDDARAQCEEQAYALLALQAPVATDLRTVLAAIHAAESLERMGDLALHVAKAARRRHPEPVLPDAVRPYFAEMGEIAVKLARQTEQVIKTKDVEAAKTLESDDDEVDDIHRHLFTVLMDREWPHGVAAAVDVTLLGRFYERYADHAVSVAKRMIFVVTGKMPGYGSNEDV
ncbi:phosphate transport system protein [Amycolatopsis mediterranei S699]|uniref:Phosphate-specific transport system accessory protein PhoU n=2 Tax=Amycolatopsis mediterranei TaxID=33910 RepID=A0A0H3DKD9_AMYMU|nr:phosphate signaling complex protein PhoU [Amycolatopsis mediterranei]ADJ50692.1 phosphate transport system protein [Amycolatopsis mediterranei U32]AEK47700.1 phosphate transport system protein [Amycolatopsis mediterranei S699]AFO82398.1 phosphate transport system protein [Amycolatopsis mediterranei S699]AGT89527.1 phosphate transport system protein [Amycolatopsis mediterranei RB]KDO12315.1 PhoU family transcriptional regulator [Amycolatopsis mediterranei]